MHASVREWVAERTAGARYGQVVEIGSLDVNGGVRDIVAADRWLGIDVVAGPGVDLVCDAHHLDLIPPSSADLVLCLEMLEHDADPNATFAEIARILTPAGSCLLTTRAEGFPHHHPPDYWRFTHDDIAALAFTAGLVVVVAADDPMPTHPGVFADLRRPSC